MKMQKVEIEVPIFDGYKFDGYRSARKDEQLENLCVYFVRAEIISEVVLIKAENVAISPLNKYFFYKKKPPRKIIYEEVREDHLKRGDFYRDEDGDVNMWISDMPSCEKHPILKKVHDGFGEKS